MASVACAKPASAWWRRNCCRPTWSTVRSRRSTDLNASPAKSTPSFRPGRGTATSWLSSPSGAIVGAAGGGVDEDGVGHLYVIYLDPDRRGEGIGSRLLDYVSEQQRALGAERQQVAVLADNHRGLPFYKAHGFSEVARRLFPGDHPDGAPELVLERGL